MTRTNLYKAECGKCHTIIRANEGVQVYLDAGSTWGKRRGFVHQFEANIYEQISYYYPRLHKIG